MKTLGVAGRKLALAGALACAGALPSGAAAQDYPAKPITIVVAFPAGSATDNLIRPIANALQKALGRPVLVDNKPGAQGVVGTHYAARARPDGYTLLAASSTTLAAHLGLFKTLPYDPRKDFQPVAGVGSISQIFLVRSDSPAKDLKGFLALAGKEPSPMPAAYGSPSAQVVLAMLSRASSVGFTPVPYKGTPQVIADLIGGAVPMGIVDIGNGVPHLKSGRLTALAVSSATRSVSAPEVPTLAETYPNMELATWIGLVAPAGTPMPIVEKLNAAVTSALATAEMKERFAAICVDIDPASPGELSRRIVRDQVTWIELIKAAGIQPE
jgi:tripartite-type tricarboxylate transporter receptor subunit TctC